MAILQLLRNVTLVVRHTVCHQFISLLQLNPNHIENIVSYPAWESLFLWLLCKQDSKLAEGDTSKAVLPNNEEVVSTATPTPITPNCDNKKNGATPSTEPSVQSHYSYTHWSEYFDDDDDDDIYRTFAVVTETIGYILWHQISQGGGGLWQTWGHLLGSLDEFIGKHTLIVPHFIIKQRYIELGCLPRSIC